VPARTVERRWANSSSFPDRMILQRSAYKDQGRLDFALVGLDILCEVLHKSRVNINNNALKPTLVSNLTVHTGFLGDPP
jgi:hypothetical protein